MLAGRLSYAGIDRRSILTLKRMVHSILQGSAVAVKQRLVNSGQCPCPNKEEGVLGVFCWHILVMAC
jgi:hypothetical protein